MNKGIIFSLLVLFVLFSAIFFQTDFLERNSIEIVNDDPPQLRKLSIEGVSNDTHVNSFTLKDKETLIASLDPKPDIVAFVFVAGSELKTSTLFRRSDWRINDLSFTDNLTGFAVGDFGTVLKTSDGGRTWTPLQRFSDFDLNRVEFLNESVGFVAGQYGEKNKTSNRDEWSTEIFKTEDGGTTWTTSFRGENERTIFQIVVCSAEIALASIDGRRLIRTEDGGRNWKEIPYGGTQVTSLAHAPDKSLWLVGGKGEFLKSVDLGLTWQSPRAFPSDMADVAWWSIDFDTLGNGLAVSENGITVYTSDSGKDWKRILPDTDDRLRAVSLRGGTAVILWFPEFLFSDFLTKGRNR